MGQLYPVETQAAIRLVCVHRVEISVTADQPAVCQQRTALCEACELPAQIGGAGLALVAWRQLGAETVLGGVRNSNHPGGPLFGKSIELVECSHHSPSRLPANLGNNLLGIHAVGPRHVG